MDKTLKNKKILLICPKFFNYHIEIINAIKELGASVDYFDERPSNSNVMKALLRINKKFIDFKVNKYYEEIYAKIQGNQYDYMLVIKPEAIPQEFILKFKEKNPNANVCMYLWDSIENNKQAKNTIKLADKVFSFDKNDCHKYNMIFRPLFYNERYEQIGNSKNKCEYDLLFIGTVHSDRYDVLKKIQDILTKQGYKIYFYMYIQSKQVYYIRKILFRDFRGAKSTDFKFKSLNQDEVIELVKKSNTILDIQHAKQTGLTMRTIEMLGANKKIITTNKEILNYDFYKKENIQVINRVIEDIDINFLNEEYNIVNSIQKSKYNIKNWIVEVLG